MTAVAPTRRVSRGRGHGYLLDGEQVDGVTKVLGQGYPKPALINWAANETAGYAVDHWDELAQVGLAERLRTLERARFDPLRQAGERGSEIHTYVHRLAAGEEVRPPDGFVAHVDAYLRFADEWQPTEVLVEAIVINRQGRPYMGTLDTIADLADGARWLLDFKTSAKGVFLDHVLQLAAYRYAESYLDASGAEHELPSVDRVGVVWLRADGYDLIPVVADQTTFRTFRYVQEVSHYTQQPYEAFIGDALTPPKQVSE
jgi:hypothetical protein